MPVLAEDAPRDMRANVPAKSLNYNRTFDMPKTRTEWERRRTWLKQHLLVSLGLSPLPPKTPLKPQITDLFNARSRA